MQFDGFWSQRRCAAPLGPMFKRNGADQPMTIEDADEFGTGIAPEPNNARA